MRGNNISAIVLRIATRRLPAGCNLGLPAAPRSRKKARSRALKQFVGMGGVELFNHLFDRTADDCASTSATSAITSPDIQRRIPFEICFSGIIQLPHCRSFFIKKVGFGSITLNRVLILRNIVVFHNFLLSCFQGGNFVGTCDGCGLYYFTYALHHDCSIFIKNRISVFIHFRLHFGDGLFAISCSCCGFRFPDFVSDKLLGCFHHLRDPEMEPILRTCRITISGHNVECPVKIIFTIVQVFVNGVRNIIHRNAIRNSSVFGFINLFLGF